MSNMLAAFEGIVRVAKHFGQRPAPEVGAATHPFDERNIHTDVAAVAAKLFDNGHYSQATFEAFKLLDSRVRALTGLEETGFSLMMNAFNEQSPKIKLNSLTNLSDKDEQKGFRYVFAGVIAGIRNPRGHEHLTDPIDLCLDHLSVASVLMRVLEARIYPPSGT
jgi:uncharacterized protein (TIGR02391 family)